MKFEKLWVQMQPLVWHFPSLYMFMSRVCDRNHVSRLTCAWTNTVMNVDVSDGPLCENYIFKPFLKTAISKMYIFIY